MTINTLNLLEEVRKNLDIERDDWYSYLNNPQSINQKFFEGQTNLSLDIFTLTKIYNTLAANFVRVLSKISILYCSLIINDVEEATSLYEELIGLG